MNVFYQPYWSDELEHHGVKGQTWGDRNGPPYPLSRGKDGRVTQTQKKKKQSFLSRMRAEHQKKQKAKQRAKAKAEKAKQAEKEKKETMSKDELREKLLKSTDPKFISQHMDLLSTNEIKERLDRINTETNLKKLLKNDSNKKKVEAGMKWVDNISKIADATSKAAKAYGDVYDATQKKEKRKEEKEAAKRAESTAAKTNAKLQNVIETYTNSVDALGDIKVDFDPKTGKLSFQTIKKDKKKK